MIMISQGYSIISFLSFWSPPPSDPWIPGPHVRRDWAAAPWRCGPSAPAWIFQVIRVISVYLYIHMGQMYMYRGIYMGVSKNSGTPEWIVYNGKPYSNGWFGGTTILGNPHLYHYNLLNVGEDVENTSFFLSCFTPLRKGIPFFGRGEKDQIGGNLSR